MTSCYIAHFVVRLIKETAGPNKQFTLIFWTDIEVFPPALSSKFYTFVHFLRLQEVLFVVLRGYSHDAFQPGRLSFGILEIRKKYYFFSRSAILKNEVLTKLK